jgi:hypothetical protein
MNRQVCGYLRMLVLAICTCGLAAGCAELGERHDPMVQDSDPSWTSGMRLPSASGEAFGISRKAREVERNLGFR